LDYYDPMNRPSLRLSLSIALAIFLAAVGFGAIAAPTEEPEPPVKSALDRDLFFRLLVGELSAQRGDSSTAYSLMLDAARKAKSEPVYLRAVDLALAARSGESALTAARDWALAFPASSEANRYLLQILIGLDKTAETLDPLKRTLAALAPPERLRSIGLLPRMYARATDKKLAASIVKQALASDLASSTTGPTAWSSVGILRLAAGDSPGGLDAAQRGAAANPTAEEPIYLALYLTGPKSDAADAIVRKFLGNSQSLGVRMAYARKLLELRRYAESYVQTVQLTTENAANAQAWLLRGSLELQNNQLAQANSSLTTFVALAIASSMPHESTENGPGLVQAYLMLAEIAEKNKKFDEANAYLQRIDSPKDTVRVQTRRAIILAKQGKMAQARALIRSLPETQSTDARTKIAAEVQLLRDFKDYQAAYQLLSTAVAKTPQDIDLTYDLATIAEKLGNVDEMEKLLRQVIATKPDYHPAYNALGYSLADRNLRLPEARQLIKKALEFAPEDPFIVDSLAWVEFRSGNSTEALRLLKGAYQARPDAEIAAHLGEVLWDLGEYAQAAEIWKQGKALNPDNETLLETIQRLSPKP
jgi:tetratricopeptide (TPR) repeat protein